MKSKTLLVIDDEKDQRDAIRAILEPFWEVLEAADFDDALSVHRQNMGRIQLLLVDVSLPGGNGYDLCEAILELEPYLKVMYLSGLAGAELRRFAPLSAGARFLQKPFEAADLLDQVHALLDNAAHG
jgi:DNA-binding response OmpR family regulator